MGLSKAVQTSRAWKWCFCGLPLAILLAGLLSLGFGFVNGDSKAVLGSFLFLSFVAVGCAAAALVNLGALKLLGKLVGNREGEKPSGSGKHENAP